MNLKVWIDNSKKNKISIFHSDIEISFFEKIFRGGILSHDKEITAGY